ncbi:MAG: hypothetical protein D3X82_15155 [Candidatus Leucobacter sulfamidivorax]|nr:hypothetical protein [Candidatus Leucobacter sulfamidivorax]
MICRSFHREMVRESDILYDHRVEETDRSPLPSVREVLELPELRAGSPTLLASEAELDREVRWAHVVAGAGSATLLDGGELVLTTGAGWPSDPAALSAFAEQLATAGGGGVAAIVLELGRGFAEAPVQLIRACAAHGVPLVALRDEVRFVQITQRVHQRILAAQTEALEAREAVHAMLTELGLNRSPVDYVVERLADTLGAPVVLEDSAYRVVAFAAAGGDVAGALAPWGASARRCCRPERVPVEARGRRWGISPRCPARAIRPDGARCWSSAPSRSRSAASPTRAGTTGCSSARSACSTLC